MNELIAACPWWGLLLITLLSAGIIVSAGTRLTHCADAIGDRTRLGKSLIGSVLLGATTSLPGIIASVTAAAQDLPELAAANAIGGIAAQTAFLGVADLLYRKANLEHDAASIHNIVQCTLLVVVLSLPLAAARFPLAADWPIHPATPLLVAAYLSGLHLIQRSSDRPMWLPRGGLPPEVDREADTVQAQLSSAGLGWRVAVFAVLVGTSGYAVTTVAGSVVARTGIDQAVAGALGVAVITSLPELVTTITAVRVGALSLAVGGIIGGNAFDVMFLAAADVTWLDGSIYHAISQSALTMLTLTITMVAILILGLAYRQKRGPARIGFETVLVLACYLVGSAVLVLDNFFG